LGLFWGWFSPFFCPKVLLFYSHVKPRPSFGLLWLRGYFPFLTSQIFCGSVDRFGTLFLEDFPHDKDPPLSLEHLSPPLSWQSCAYLFSHPSLLRTKDPIFFVSLVCPCLLLAEYVGWEWVVGLLAQPSHFVFSRDLPTKFHLAFRPSR